MVQRTRMFDQSTDSEKDRRDIAGGVGGPSGCRRVRRHAELGGLARKRQLLRQLLR